MSNVEQLGLRCRQDRKNKQCIYPLIHYSIHEGSLFPLNFLNEFIDQEIEDLTQEAIRRGDDDDYKTIYNQLQIKKFRDHSFSTWPGMSLNPGLNIHTYIHTYTYTYIFKYTCMHTHIHTYLLTYIHTYIHML